MVYAIRLCGQCRVWFLTEARDFALLQNAQTGSGVHPAFNAMVSMNFSPLEAQWLGREDDHTPPSSVMVKNKCSYTSALPVYIHAVDWANYTFLWNGIQKNTLHCGHICCIVNVNVTIFVLQVPHQNTCAICINRKGNEGDGKEKGNVLWQAVWCLLTNTILDSRSRAMSWWSFRMAISQGVNLSWFSTKRGEPWLRSSSTHRFRPDVAAQCNAVFPFCHPATKHSSTVEIWQGSEFYTKTIRAESVCHIHLTQL
jgi:hypothetical protein